MGFSYESSEGICERVVIGSQARLRIWCLVRMGSSPFARTQSSGDKAFRLRYHCFCIMIFLEPPRLRGKTLCLGIDFLKSEEEVFNV